LNQLTRKNRANGHGNNKRRQTNRKDTEARERERKPNAKAAATGNNNRDNFISNCNKERAKANKKLDKDCVPNDNISTSKGGGH